MWKATDATILTAVQKEAEAKAVLKAEFQAAIQRRVDQVAGERAYSDGNSCASYSASTNTQWAGEATAFIAWRDAVWVYAYGELDKVEAGTRELPAIADFLNELPAMTWPAVETT